VTQFIGWCDTSKTRILTEKVAAAVNHYRQKFGADPTVCYVNPAQLNGATRAGGVELRAGTPGSNPVPPGHLWIGVES